MNKSFDNLFIEAIKKDDLQRGYVSKHLESFDQSISIEERVNSAYEQYKELKHDYIKARDTVTDIFTVSGNLDDLTEYREIRNSAQEALDQYANDVCRDKDFMGYLAENDTKEFNAMNERFNELMQEQTQEMQKELEKEL